MKTTGFTLEDQVIQIFLPKKIKKKEIIFEIRDFHMIWPKIIQEKYILFIFNYRITLAYAEEKFFIN